MVTTNSDGPLHPPTPENEARPKVDIIWNVTYVCPWNCDICCVDAKYVTRRGGLVTIQSDSLQRAVQIPFVQGAGTQYDQALTYLQRAGLELTLSQKLQVIDNLAGFDAKLDFSGGDVLSVRENLEVLRIAASRLGRDHVTLTATGAGLARIDPSEVGAYILELNFTYDSVTVEGNDCRPAGYASGNLRRAADFARLGITTRAECPLNSGNLDDETLVELYRNLHEAGTDQLLLMRLFPVGRGAFRKADVPTPAQYRHAIEVLRAEEARLVTPKLKLQCALKFFDRQDMNENPCDAVRESFGLMADGTLLASPWAVSADGRPLDDAWVLGSLANAQLKDILRTEKARVFAARVDESFGHCKIFSFMNSPLKNSTDRIFDPVDPLYLADTTASAAAAG